MMIALVVFLSFLSTNFLGAHYQFNQILRINRLEENPLTTLFSHGVGADHHQADFYRGLFCTKNYIAFNFPNAPEKIFNRNQNTGLAQQSEMDSFGYVLDTALEYDQPVVLYGLSRGASVIINVLGSRSAAQRQLPHIQAVVLESPFAHCEDIIRGYAQQFKLPPFFMRFLAKRFFKEYHKAKNAPIDLVEYLPNTIPILFICTSEDTIVPAGSTKRLYAALRNLGHEHVYLVEFPSGIHANIVWGMYGREYHAVIHAFYAKYGLPHNQELAALGKPRLEVCQPRFDA